MIEELLKLFKKAEKNLIKEFEADGLDYDGDTIGHVELTLDEMITLQSVLNYVQQIDEDLIFEILT